MSLAGIVLAYSGVACAHPDGAPPVDHPLVVGFERFFAEGDSSQYLATGGFLLIQELGCVACHAAPRGWVNALAPSHGGASVEVMSRGLEYPELWLAIRNPPTFRNGARMPELFAHASRDPDHIVALASYLHLAFHEEVAGNAPPPPGEAAKEGDPAVGRELYHRVGCIACHAPEVPEGEEEPNVNSISLGVAEVCEPEMVAGILSGGRNHPDFQLAPQERADLVAYLQTPGGTEVGVDPALLAGEPVPGLVGEGSRLFQEMRCVSCHEGGKPKAPSQAPVRLPGLITLRAGEGCVSLTPEMGIPYFGLSSLQREAIAMALARLAEDPSGDAWTEEEAIDLRLEARNCYACHTWREKGGLEGARAALMGGQAREKIPSLDRLTDDPRTGGCRFRVAD